MEFNEYQRIIKWLVFLIFCYITVIVGACLIQDDLMLKIGASGLMYAVLTYGFLNQGIEIVDERSERDWIIGKSFVLWT